MKTRSGNSSVASSHCSIMRPSQKLSQRIVGRWGEKIGNIRDLSLDNKSVSKIFWMLCIWKFTEGIQHPEKGLDTKLCSSKPSGEQELPIQHSWLCSRRLCVHDLPWNNLHTACRVQDGQGKFFSLNCGYLIPRTLILASGKRNAANVPRYIIARPSPSSWSGFQET